MRRLNELGFDVDEVELIDAGDGGNRLRLRTRVAEPGHHRRLLFTRTGLDAQENQARRLLNDIASFRAWLEQAERPAGARGGRGQPLAERGVRAGGRRDPGATCAIGWTTAEIFHEILEHRWFLSEPAGRDIGTTARPRRLLRRRAAGGAARPHRRHRHARHHRAVKITPGPLPPAGTVVRCRAPAC